MWRYVRLFLGGDGGGGGLSSGARNFFYPNRSCYNLNPSPCCICAAQRRETLLKDEFYWLNDIFVSCVFVGANFGIFVTLMHLISSWILLLCNIDASFILVGWVGGLSPHSYTKKSYVGPLKPVTSDWSKSSCKSYWDMNIKQVTDRKLQCYVDPWISI